MEMQMDIDFEATNRAFVKSGRAYQPYRKAHFGDEISTELVEKVIRGTYPNMNGRKAQRVLEQLRKDGLVKVIDPQEMQTAV